MMAPELNTYYHAYLGEGGSIPKTALFSKENAHKIQILTEKQGILNF